MYKQVRKGGRGRCVGVCLVWLCAVYGGGGGVGQVYLQVKDARFSVV